MTTTLPPPTSPLRRVLNDQGVTLTGLARRLGISPGYLAALARGDYHDPSHYLDTAALMLGVTLADLTPEVKP